MIKAFLNSLKRQTRENCTAVIVAAGMASRMQGADKICAELCGKPVIAYTIEAFMESSVVTEIILVTRPDLVGYLRSLCAAKGYHKVIAVVPGGKNRTESVMLGLDCVSSKSGLVAIHDGARPLVTTALIDEVIAKGHDYHAAAPAVPVKDTIKIAQDHIAQRTLDRSTLFAVQTPQVFDYDLLRGALKKVMDEDLPITDDCSAVENIGMRVYLTNGAEENIKITTPLDLVLAETILQRRLQS